jgi:glycosyltransferase involved in cell wall biosynthesis
MLTYHFPPSAAAGAFRLLGFARHLPTYGWESAVVAPPGLPWEPVDPGLMQRVPPATTLYQAPYPRGLAAAPFRRLFPYAAWLPAAYAASRSAIRHERPDALFTSGPPHAIHLLGRHLHRRYGLPWLVDFRDPWAAGGLSALHGRPPSRWDVRAERSVLRDADRIIANTPRAMELLATAFPQHRVKMVSITNGFDPDSFSVLDPAPRDPGAVSLVHPGEVYASRDPRPLLEAIRALKPGEIPEGRPLRVRFIGRQGPGAPILNDLIRESGLQDIVTFTGQVPYSRSLAEMVAADVLLLLDSAGRRAGVPAKLYEYLGAGRPVLALADPGGDVDWVLRESGTPYRIAPPLDASRIHDALVSLLREASAAPAANDGAAQSRFTRQAVTGELARLLDECVGHGDTGLTADPESGRGTGA